MWNGKKRAALLLAAAMGMSVIAGAMPAMASEEPTTLVYGSGDYTRINPAMDEHCEINVLLFDGLTDHDGDNNIIPRLAKEWTYDEETTTYTFYLEEGVKWHDGEEFTAEDVKFTIEAIMDPENGAENAPNYEDVEEITVIDPYTVSFKLSAPNYAFLEYMTMAILPKHLLEGEDMQESDFFRAPIGTGPYKLTGWDEGQAIIMEKNEDYFAGPANIDRLIFKIVTDDNAKALQLQSGELNLSQVTPKDAVLFENDGVHTVYDEKTSDYRGILYNFWNEYWQENADLIPAISYAIDRQAILDAVLLGCGDVAYGPLQRNVYNCEDVEHYDYDPAKAEELLAAAGCEKDAEGFWCRNDERISFVINATPGDQVRVDMAMIAAQQLQAIGLDVSANVPADGIDWGGQQCCIIGWGSPFDADDHTYKVFGTDKGANYSGYSNELVDEYLTAARQTDVPEERMAAYADFQKELAQTPAYTFFCYIDAMYVADSTIQGIATDTVLGHHGVGIFWNVCDWTIE
ncbi:MAG: ABC transporter substrate-binding protein [Lachnospiraceae bacterium]|nr:ABC transporter substrate-binding protein [Lachnospiraceae bacterium]